MLRKPLFWGFAAFSIAVLGWFISIIVSVLTNGALKDAANIFGYVAIASLPVAGILELVFWVIRGDMENTDSHIQ